MKRKLDWRLHSYRTQIVLEDDDLIVLNKPAGMLVLPDRYDRSLPNLSSILREELGMIYVVHRLDKETSGVILFAKKAGVHAVLNEQFEGREIEKSYHAIVVGKPTDKHGVIDLPLLEHPSRAGMMTVNRSRGKESTTEYRVLEAFDGYAFVEAMPQTGRTHQIRVHLQAVGLPILCDPLYGDGKGFFLSEIKRGYRTAGEEKPLLNRTALHASALAFVHPASNAPTRVSAPLPKDMSSVLKYLRKFRPER